MLKEGGPVQEGDNSGLRPCENFRMSSPTDNLTTVRRYLKTIEDGIFADIANLFNPDILI